MIVKKCPVCGKPRSQSHTPFCSSRCRDRDLMQWLSDGYALPGAPANEGDEKEARENDF